MTVYRPREDSYLLKDYIESLDLEGEELLDMGTGTGIVGITAAKNNAVVTAADIDPDALEIAEQKAHEEEVADSIDFVETDLFENIEGEFDYIVFNPPYLSGERQSENDALVGGEAGTEIIERFLSKASRYLKSEGQVFFVASSLSELEALRRNYDLELVDKEELWFETLYLFRVGNSFL